MLLSPPTVNADRFQWQPSSATLVAEASDLRGFFRLGRVYDDACDEGFTLVGRQRSIVFCTEHVQRDREGDLLYTDYRPAPYQGQTPDVTVRVYND